jgi:hypothetical protein
LQFDLRSETGRSYRIFVAYPSGDAPAGGYSVF